MVAAEAAACGALPVAADHSGLAEVARTFAPALDEPLRRLLTFERGPEAVEQLADGWSPGSSSTRPSASGPPRRWRRWPTSATPGRAWRAASSPRPGRSGRPARAGRLSARRRSGALVIVPPARWSRGGGARSFWPLAALVAVAAGCGTRGEADLENGKRLYTGQLAEGQKPRRLPALRRLPRAGARQHHRPGGPEPGRGVRHGAQRRHDRRDRRGRRPRPDRAPAARAARCPPDLVTGDDARDVAAYVARSPASPARTRASSRRSAAPQTTKPIAAKGGVLTIPADRDRRARVRQHEGDGAGRASSSSSCPTRRRSSTTSRSRAAATGPVVGTGGVSKFSADRQAPASTSTTARCRGTRRAA